MKFGHHQSFYLRVNWLSKAMKMIDSPGGDRFFYEDEEFHRIGLGRNMVKSLRYWALATGIMRETRNAEDRPAHELTETGRLLYENDRYVRLPLTAAVLHVALASDREQAPTLYWFFNEYAPRSSSPDEALAALARWAEQHQTRTVSIHSLKRDVDCLRLLYTAEAQQENDPEDVIASPLSGLELLYPTRDLVKRTPELEKVDIDALYYALLLYAEDRAVDSVTVEELAVQPLLWGKLFHLTSGQIMEALETLQAEPAYPVAFVRTNRIYSLRFERENPFDFLRRAYERKAAY